MTLTDRTTMVLAFVSMTIDSVMHWVRGDNAVWFAAAVALFVGTILQVSMLWLEWKQRRDGR